MSAATSAFPRDVPPFLSLHVPPVHIPGTYLEMGSLIKVSRLNCVRDTRSVPGNWDLDGDNASVSAAVRRDSADLLQIFPFPSEQRGDQGKGGKGWWNQAERTRGPRYVPHCLLCWESRCEGPRWRQLGFVKGWLG